MEQQSQSRKKGKRGVYTLISAFLVITIAVFIVIGFTRLSSFATLFRAEISDDFKADITAMGEKEIVKACYGRIIDMQAAHEPACAENRLIKGVTVSAISYPGCDAGNITIVPVESNGSASAYSSPVYQHNRTIICPGRIVVYT